MGLSCMFWVPDLHVHIWMIVALPFCKCIKISSSKDGGWRIENVLGNMWYNCCCKMLKLSLEVGNSKRKKGEILWLTDWSVYSTSLFSVTWFALQLRIMFEGNIALDIVMSNGMLLLQALDMGTILNRNPCMYMCYVYIYIYIYIYMDMDISWLGLGL